MTHVAVAPCKHLRGFRGEGFERVPSGYWVREVQDALTRSYRTDAHLVTYVVEGARRQPRINKVGLPVFPGQVWIESFFCDVDNHGHALWDADLTRAALAQYEQFEILQTTGLYFTRRGRRLVQPLAEPLPVVDAERALSQWLAALEIAGLEVDWACRDWTRHFRLPNVVRDGREEIAPVLRLERMAPMRPDVPDSEPHYPIPSPRSSGLRLAEPRRARYARSEEAPVFQWTTQVDPSWVSHVDRVASAVRQVKTEWHSLFLAIAGALIERGAELEDLPLLCRCISEATGADDRTSDREAIGRSTAERSLMGMPVMGLGALRRRWPIVAAAFEPAAPMRFRELTALLEAAGGSRALAALAGLKREVLVRLLQGDAPTKAQSLALRLAADKVDALGGRASPRR